MSDDKEYTELELVLRAPLFALPVAPLMLLWAWPAWYQAVAVWLLATATTYAYGWWIRDNIDVPVMTEPDGGSIDADRVADQSEVVEQLVHVVAPEWSVAFERPDLVCYNELPERLNAVVRSVLTELDGEGDIQPHRLTPQSNPGVDLFDKDRAALRDYPYIGNGRDARSINNDTLAFVTAIQSAQDRVIADPGQPEVDNVRRAVGELLAGICEIIEAGYVLVPQFYDDDGELESEGQDIAPGLTAAFTTEWERNESP